MSGDIKRKCCLVPAKLFTFGHICSALPLSFNHLLVTSCSNHSTARRNDINVNRPFSECAFKKEREKRKTWWSKNLSLLEFFTNTLFCCQKKHVRVACDSWCSTVLVENEFMSNTTRQVDEGALEKMCSAAQIWFDFFNIQHSLYLALDFLWK